MNPPHVLTLLNKMRMMNAKTDIFERLLRHYLFNLILLDLFKGKQF